MALCPTPSPDDPLVNALLSSTDCHVEALVRSGYSSLFAPEGVYGGVLTAIMVAYIALMGYRLLLGQGQLAIGELAMTAVKIGVVLSLATQWGTYQTVVYRAAFDGPAQMGNVVLHGLASQGVLAGGDVYDGLQRAYDDLTAFSPAAPPGGANSPTQAGGQPAAAPTAVAPATAAATPAQGANSNNFIGKAGFDSVLLLVSAIMLLLTTLGVLLAAKVVLGFLLAVGPLFVAMLLFDSTRGLFIGWIRAVLGFALAPLTTSLLLGLGLSLLDPSLQALEAMRDSNTYTPGVAYSVLILVLVLAGVAVGLLIGTAVIAGGLRAPGASRGRAGTSGAPASAAEPARDGAVMLGRSARTAAAAEAQAMRDARILGGASTAAATAAADGGERRVSLSVLAGGRAPQDSVAVESRLGQAPRRSAQPRTPSPRAAPSGAQTQS